MNEQLIDQIPALASLQRALDELRISNTENIGTVNPFIVEAIPEIRTSIMHGKNWRKIAEMQKDKFFSNSPEEQKREIEKLMSLYSTDMLEPFCETPGCAVCGKDAMKRCSSCKLEWYCSGECQLKAWKLHKKMC